MKKSIFIIISTCITLLLGMKVSAETLNVSVPKYEIEVNGQVIENTYREYPFLEYNDILYFPLSHNMCSFAGLETHYGKKGYNENSPCLFYVGKRDQREKNFSEIVSNQQNVSGDFHKTYIVKYDVYIQSQKYNSEKRYPVVNFRGVTYIPLVWDVAVKLFDWECSFDGKVYVINTEKAVRPKLDYMTLWSTSPSPYGGIKGKFLYGKNFYIQYPGTTFGEVVDFVYKSEESEVRFNLINELYSLGITSLGSQKAPDLYTSNDYIEHTPLFDGRYFAIICLADKEHLIIKIDMLNGAVISAQKI